RFDVAFVRFEDDSDVLHGTRTLAGDAARSKGIPGFRLSLRRRWIKCAPMTSPAESTFPRRFTRRHFIHGFSCSVLGALGGLGWMRFVESRWLEVVHLDIALGGGPPVTLLQL